MGMSAPAAAATTQRSDDSDARRSAFAHSLDVQREEVTSLKDGRAVYLRRSNLFFRASKSEVLDHIDDAKAAAPGT